MGNSGSAREGNTEAVTSISVTTTADAETSETPRSARFRIAMAKDDMDEVKLDTPMKVSRAESVGSSMRLKRSEAQQTYTATAPQALRVHPCHRARYYSRDYTRVGLAEKGASRSKIKLALYSSLAPKEVADVLGVAPVPRWSLPDMDLAKKLVTQEDEAINKFLSRLERR